MGQTCDNTQVLAEVSQRQGLFSRHTLKLFADRLEISRQSLWERMRYFVYFGGLKEQPDTRTRPYWGYFVAAVLLVALGVWVFQHLPPVDRRLLGMQATFAVVFGGPALCLAAVGLRRFFSSGIYVLSYRANAPGKPVPDVWVRRSSPSSAAVAEFLDAYRSARAAWESRFAAVTAAQTTQGGSEAADLERFADLLDADILTPEEFEHVKARIIGGERRSIGFRP